MKLQINSTELVRSIMTKNNAWLINLHSITIVRPVKTHSVLIARFLIMRIKVIKFEKLLKFMTILLRKFNKKSIYCSKSPKKCNSKKKQLRNESQSGIQQKRTQSKKLRKRWRMQREKSMSSYKQSFMYFWIKVIKSMKKLRGSKNVIERQWTRFKNAQRHNWSSNLSLSSRTWSLIKS